jgi:hypothetical protein
LFASSPVRSLIHLSEALLDAANMTLAKADDSTERVSIIPAVEEMLGSGSGTLDSAAAAAALPDRASLLA